VAGQVCFLSIFVQVHILSAFHITVVELGAGSGLPSLLLATLPDPPSLVVITDHPDPGILGNLKTNVEQNRTHFQPYWNARAMNGEEMWKCFSWSRARSF